MKAHVCLNFLGRFLSTCLSKQFLVSKVKVFITSLTHSSEFALPGLTTCGSDSDDCCCATSYWVAICQPTLMTVYLDSTSVRFPHLRSKFTRNSRAEPLQSNVTIILHLVKGSLSYFSPEERDLVAECSRNPEALGAYFSTRSSWTSRFQDMLA